METVLQDLRYAIRMLVKSPAFTAVAVLTLALGIGANTAIFTLVNALLLKMLPVQDPQHLVVLGNPAASSDRYNGTPSLEVFSYPLYREFRDRNSVFTGLAASATDHHIQVDAQGSGGFTDEQINGRMVSGNYFSVLGLEPAAGRLFSDSDDTAENANPVVVLSYAYWRNKFALSPAIIGEQIRLNEYPFTVIGVAPRGFDGDIVGEEMLLYVPLSMQPEIVRGRHWRNLANTSWLSLIGRLKPGTSAAQAQADVNVVLQQAIHGTYAAGLSSDDLNFLRSAKINVVPGGAGLSALRNNYRLPLLLLMGIVGLVLLIACVNVANLLLARASGRSKEVAIRLAIGAGRNRLIRQLLTESILLAFIGGIAGALLSIWGVRLLLRLLGSDASLPVRPDLRVLGFTMGICLLTGILFGLVPALRTLRIEVTSTLKDAASPVSETKSRFGWGKGLVTGQVALSLLVLFAGGLLVRSLQNVMSQDFGYDRDRLIVARLDATAVGYKPDRLKVLAQQLAERVSAAPGVRGVTYSTNGLFSGSESGDAIVVPGFNASKNSDRVAMEDYVGPGYFGVIGIPVLAGRGIEAQDTATSTRVAVVNEAMVKYFFHGENPIGRQFTIDDADWKNKPFTIVGISRNAKDHGSGLRKDVKPRFYQAFQQYPDPFQIMLDVQAGGPVSAVVANVTQQIKAVDPRLPVPFIRPLDYLVTHAAADQIAMAKLSAYFAGLALVLACIGIYGVMSYTVAGRTREIGLRMALGAQRGTVLGMVLSEALLLLGVGLAIGIPVSLVSSRLLKSMLFGLSSTDPASLGIVVLVLVTVAVCAGFIPARRATKVDPMVALRYE